MKFHIKCYVWKQIFKFLTQQKGLHSRTEVRLRHFIEAVWYAARSGCQWRLLPAYYGCWRKVHRRFKRWCDRGIWQRMLEAIADPDKESHMIDSTIVRAHACSAGYGQKSQTKQALGRSKGGFTTKIHALVDGLGYPLKMTLTGGQRHDITQAEPLTRELSDTTLIADRGYESAVLIESLAKKGCRVVMPPQKNSKVQRVYDRHIYKERHLIECFFGKTKHFRRVFSRFDKTAKVFLGFLHFVSVLIWLR